MRRIAVVSALLAATLACAAAPARLEWRRDILLKRAPSAQGWRYLILHHSGTAEGSGRSFDAYHRARGWGGLAYHFVVGNGNGMEDGELFTGRRWDTQMAGTHISVRAWHHNIFGIGICLVGNFNRTAPTEAQLDTLVALMKTLVKEHGIKRGDVLGHAQVPQSVSEWRWTTENWRIVPKKFEKPSCPGRYFPMEEILDRVYGKRS